MRSSQKEQTTKKMISGIKLHQKLDQLSIWKVVTNAPAIIK